MGAAALHCDLLVVGSGAAGLAAAVTAAHHGLKVVLVEKDAVFGGATAWSGGWLWVPGNPLARRAGIHEGPQQPRTYLRHALGPRYDAERVDAFLDHAGAMVAFFEQHTALQFVDGNAIPDMHQQLPGAATQGHQVAAAPGATEHLALPPEACAGDGITLGESAGGVLQTDVASAGAWAPVSRVPHADGSVGHFPHIIDRGKPGLIGVLADGRRFVNEADGYYDYTATMLAAVPPGQQVASWLVCDHRFVRRYGLGHAKPFPLPLGPHLRSGYLQRGATIEALATACRIDPAGLAATLRAFNAGARRGAARTAPSAAAAAPTTANRVTPCTAPTPAWCRSSTGLSMR